MENLYKTENTPNTPNTPNNTPKIYTAEIPSRERYPKVFNIHNIIPEEDWTELRREEDDDREFAELNGMDPIYWCPACKVGVCEIRNH